MLEIKNLVPQDTQPLEAVEVCLVGLDIGGTKSHVAVADARSGRIVTETLLRTDAYDGHELHMALSDAVETILPASGAVAGVGIGIAGAVDARAPGLELAPNLSGLDVTSMTSELTSRWNVPVVVENDVNAAAVGERAVGGAQGVDDFVFIAVGTGIGMGTFSGGRLIRGARNAAGEIGYLSVGVDPFDPAYRTRGPLEDVVSGPGIAAAYARLGNVTVTTQEVFDRQRDDIHAAAVLDTFSRSLALAIASVRAILDPSLVVLGGGVGSRQDVLGWLRPWLDRLDCADLAVRTSRLGPTATVHGALELARTVANRGTYADLIRSNPLRKDGTP